MAIVSESENSEELDKTILWASTFLSREGARITSKRPAVIGGARTRRAELEAQKAERIRLLFLSGTTSTTAVVAVRRVRDGAQAVVVQDFKNNGQFTRRDQKSKADIQSPRLQPLSHDTTGFLLKYGVAGITPSMHATHLQNLFQQMYKNETPLSEDRSALNHYIYSFSINRIWQCLHTIIEGSNRPFIALFLSWESVGELSESDFRGRSPSQGSIPSDLEREDDSKLSQYIEDLPENKSKGQSVQFELTEAQAWQLLTKFKSCLGRIQSTVSMIKKLVQGHPDPEKHTVKVADRLLLTGAVKLLAANLQILGWLVHHSPSFWKLLDSLGPIFVQRMGELHRTTQGAKECEGSDSRLPLADRACNEDGDARIGAERIRNWLKQLTEYYELLYELSEGPRANGVVGGRVEITIHVLPKIPPEEELVSSDSILEGFDGNRKQHGGWSKLDTLMKPSIISSAAGCCFCCSRLLELGRVKSTNLSAELPIKPWMPPDATPKEIKLQILDDLAGLLEECLDSKPSEERTDFRSRSVKETKEV
ncbi:hypothetical protein FS837_005516 [Tulasnella sp. UAMH 9824]|nr:hypothetical protein FS837_005516 [Tulasnella sp. UAMH 9824]